MTLSATTTIRPAAERDLEAVVEAYNAGISERIATLETRLRTPADVAGWLADGRPFLVAEHEGRVLGWARAGFYSDRCVYEGVGEHAVYVHPDTNVDANGQPPAKRSTRTALSVLPSTGVTSHNR